MTQQKVVGVLFNKKRPRSTHARTVTIPYTSRGYPGDLVKVKFHLYTNDDEDYDDDDDNDEDYKGLRGAMTMDSRRS